MNQNELISIAEKWIKAWNERDQATLVSMMKEDSFFAQLGSRLYPIIMHDQPLIPNLYLREWFHRALETYKKLDLTFTIHEIKTGDGFIQIKSVLSDGNNVVDFLRVEADGKIDQQSRNIDRFQWKGIVV